MSSPPVNSMPPPLELPPDGEGWPTREQVIKLWAIGSKAIVAKVKAKTLKRYVGENGIHRYDPVELDSLYERREGTEEAFSALQKAIVASTPIDSAAAIMGELTSLLRDQRKWNAEILSMVFEPQNALLKALQGALEDSRARNEKLEADRDEALRLREQSLTDMTERAIMVEQARGTERRRSEMVSLAKQQIPTLLQAHAEGKALAFIKSLDTEMVAAFAQSGMLSGEQAKMLRSVFPGIEVVTKDEPPGDQKEDSTQ